MSAMVSDRHTQSHTRRAHPSMAAQEADKNIRAFRAELAKVNEDISAANDRKTQAKAEKNDTGYDKSNKQLNQLLQRRNRCAASLFCLRCLVLFGASLSAARVSILLGSKCAALDASSPPT